MSNKRKPEPLPAFKTDEEAERFVDEADLTAYDLSSGSVTRFEFEMKTRQVNLALHSRGVGEGVAIGRDDDE